MATKNEMVPRSTGAKKGDTGVDVRRVQSYLTQFGYFESPVLERFGVGRELAQPAPTDGTFDESTERALKTFQERYGLDPTGKVDRATLDLMKKPRCGRPDTAEFVAQGNKWDTTALRYGFVEFSADLTETQVRDSVSTALGYWAAVTPLTFTPVADSANAEIRIRFVSGDHGDGSQFDGVSGVLAHAFYPPPNGGDIAGDSHFDEDETWSVDLPASGIDLHTVAAHEFGHSLGLDHSTVASALMFPFYGGPHRHLDADDIAGIQSIYGKPEWMTTTLSRVYATPHSMNAWAYPDGVGWRKVTGTSTDGVTNTFAVLVRARAANKPVHIHVTATEIDTVYL